MTYQNDIIDGSGRIIEILKQYCWLLNASGISVSRAFLYGSYARNEATPESDIDILIVSPVFDDQNDLLKVKAWRLTEKVNNKIEPYIIGLRKFTNDDVSPLLQVVKREGIEIPVTNRIGQPTPGLQGAPTFHPPVLFSVS